MLLAACSSPSSASISAPTVQGPPGHRFALSFLETSSPKAPSGQRGESGILVPTKHGARVQSSSYWTSRRVHAFVYDLTNEVPGTRINSFLRGFVLTSHGGRIIKGLGLPAATESVPCSTPAGSWSGVVSALVTIGGGTIYDILVFAPTNSVSQAVFNSFRRI